jgi:hypothetical protein
MSNNTGIQITASEVTTIAEVLGAAASAFIPGAAAVVPAAEGIVSIFENTLLPLVGMLEGGQASIVTQASVASGEALIRLRIGAPADPSTPPKP